MDGQLHSFLSSAPGGVSGQLHVPAALSCAKPLGPLSRRLGEPESECDRFEKRYNCHFQKPKYFVTDLLTYSLALRPSESFCFLKYRRPFFSAHACCRHLLTFISRRSFSPSSNHLSPCLLILLLPYGLLPSILIP